MNRNGILSAALLLGAVMLCDAADTAAEKCRTPPKPVGRGGIYMPPTGMLPEGIVTVELTVTTEGMVKDVVIVQSSDERLDAWALVKAADMRFAPVPAPCRTRAALRHRNSANPDGKQ